MFTTAGDRAGRGRLNSGSSGAGTVTNVSSANGDLTVANPTTTPVLTVISAPKLDTGRTIAMTGDVAWTSAAFDGSANVTGTGTIQANAVTTTKINNAAVTLAKIQNAAANSKLLGSGAAGSGIPYAELTLGTNLSMSGTTLNATGGGGTVTSIATDGTYTSGGTIISTGTITVTTLSKSSIDSAQHAGCGGI